MSVATAPAAAEVSTAKLDINTTSQWGLIWYKFTRHRFAVVCGVIVLLLDVIAAFVEPIAPYDPEARRRQRLPGPHGDPFFRRRG